MRILLGFFILLATIAGAPVSEIARGNAPPFQFVVFWNSEL